MRRIGRPISTGRRYTSMAAKAASGVPVNTSQGAASPQPTVPSLAVNSSSTRLTVPLTFPTPWSRVILMGLSIRKSLIRSTTSVSMRIPRLVPLRRYVGARDGLRRGRLLPGRIGHVNRREGRPFDILAVALFGAKLAFRKSNPAARQGDDGGADALKALENIVIDPADLASRADGFARPGIPHHDVGIRTDVEPSFARIDIEDACDIGRRD